MSKVTPPRHEGHQGAPREPWSGRVIGAALRVHRELGPGLLESAYQSALASELEFASIPFEHEWPIPVTYRSKSLDTHYRVDFLVGGVLLKAGERVLPLHTAQLLTYMRLGGFGVGLLLNFSVPLLREGIFRRVL